MNKHQNENDLFRRTFQLPLRLQPKIGADISLCLIQLQTLGDYYV